MRVTKRKNKKHEFSVVKAVKAKARKTLGQPRPVQTMEDRSAKPERKEKHKKTFGSLLGEIPETDSRSSRREI